jgi:peptidoglycan hydrolase-like protein with peptidoglycan-binding domain
MVNLKHSSFKRALLAGAFLVIGGAAAQADYSVGSAAFNAGNYNRAYEEFKQSADGGNSLAQFMMGRLYAEGRGVVTDKVAAYMWYDLAASNGNTRAIAARDAIGAQLQSSDIDRAQDMAADWRLSHQTVVNASPVPATPVAITTISAPYSLRNVQVALSQLGYSVGTPDGVIGPKSRAAIRAFQVDSGLPASGEPSRTLYDKLQASIVKTSGPDQVAQPAKPAVTSTMITQVQTELRRRGYAITAISGTANAETLAAVRAYQADAKLPVTGEINDSLLQQLGTATADSGAIYRAQVKQVQAALNASGYAAGPPDGALGPKSRAAISRYQSDNGLAATGDVNAELLADLGIDSGEQPAPVRVGSTTISQTKEQLRAHGYVVDNMSGTLDPQTREAIRAYQADAGLPVNGEVSTALLENLRNSSTYVRTEDTEIVLDIEGELQRRGYTVGPVDGTLDSRSRAAVRTYQTDAGLAVTGQADDALLAHLRSSEVTAMPPAAITEIQYLLNRLGYLQADSDGVMGPQSTAAIRRYQGDRGLLVNGWPTMDLLAKLRQEPIVEPGAKNY